MRIAIVLIALTLAAGAVSAETTVTINGKTNSADGGSVIVDDSSVVVNGKVVSGNVVEGSGQSATESRELDSFNEVHLYLGADVVVIPGPKPRCRITADDNIIPLISMEISGGSLIISARECYVSRQKMTIELETPEISEAEVRGSGNIDLREISGDRLTLAISGSGDIVAEGRVDSLTVTINGSGNVDATGLEADRVAVTVNGSGDADVNAAKSLTAKILGSGDVRYIGAPADVQTSVLGSGGIVRE